MTGAPTHAVLRDGPRWEGGRTHGLHTLEDGTLVLASLPGAPSGQRIELPAPWTAEVGGLAVGHDGSVYVSDASRGRLRRFDGGCGDVREAQGFDRPAGLAVVATERGERLLVADHGGARVVVLRASSMSPEAIWTRPGSRPTALAIDAELRAYVIDGAATDGAIARLDRSGRPDAAYGQVMQRYPELRPHGLAVDADGVLLVSDRGRDAILRFDASGRTLEPLAELHVTRPRALVCDGAHLYVADADSGRIHAYDLRNGVDLGWLEGFRGPVLAMALDGEDLLVSTAPGRFVRLPAGRARAAAGLLIAGPLDAGSGRTWERAVVRAATPPSTAVRLDVALLDERSAAPRTADWRPAAGLDTLLPPPTRENQPASARYLWLRVRLVSTDRLTTPRLEQVQATTEAASYIEALPAIYAEQDGERGFLRRLLALFRAELGEMERRIDDMARRFDPATAPADHLTWLSQWLAFDLPRGATVEQQREVVERAHRLHTHRGTALGLQEAIELHTGVRVQILEAFRERRIWQLGVGSRLGVDTGLPPASADGIIVPDPTDTASAGGLVVGDFVVGESRPLSPEDLGEPLLDDTAHLFTVVVPAGQTLTVAVRQQLEAIIESDKPAHTDHHLCLVEPRMRVGFQARIGVDSIVAGPPDPMVLGDVRLGYSTYLADANEDEPAGRLGSQARVGIDTILG